jgi:hypothetical protein
MGWEDELDRLWEATAKTLDEEYIQSKAGTPGNKEEDLGKKESDQDTQTQAVTQKESTLEGTRDEAQKLAEKVNAAMKLDDSTGLETTAKEEEKPADQSDNSVSKAEVGTKPEGTNAAGEGDVAQATNSETKTSS